jgi:hypothetical protein
MGRLAWVSVNSPGNAGSSGARRSSCTGAPLYLIPEDLDGSVMPAFELTAVRC